MDIKPRNTTLERLPTPLIVLDTDITVTALLGGKNASSARVVRAVSTREVQLALSDASLRELYLTLRRPRVGLNIRSAVRALEVGLELGVMGTLYRPAGYGWPSVPGPENYWRPDLAWEAGADYSVAWDPHLTGASLPFPVEVLEPPALLERLRS